MLRASKTNSTLMGIAILSCLFPGFAHAQLSDLSLLAPIKTPTSSAYGEYLIGRQALIYGDLSRASQAWEGASLLDPLNHDLHEKAFMGAIISGDLQFAIDHPIEADKVSPFTQYLGYLLASLDNHYRSKPDLAVQNIDIALNLHSGDRTALLLRPWLLALNNRLDEASLYTPPQAAQDKLLSLYLKQTRAQLFEIQGRLDAAESLYREIYKPGLTSQFFGADYAGFLWRRGRSHEAVEVYKDILSQSSDPRIEARLKSLEQGGASPPPMKTLENGVIEALYTAASLYAGEQQNEFALVNLNLALHNKRANGINSIDDRAKILKGRVMQTMQDETATQAVWSEILPQSDYYITAQNLLADSYRKQNRYDEALAIYNNLALISPSDANILVQRVSIMRAKGANELALEVMNAHIANYGYDTFTWQTYYIQAVLYDRLNLWPQAQTAIIKARALIPHDDPQRANILNFLGYGWIDNRKDIKQGMKLVKEALEIDPKSGAIMDSLGWGYYQLGQYELAREWIEKAILLEPSNAELNEHLGDVYKALHRDNEARFEWRRALDISESEKQKTALKAKLSKP